MKSKLNTSFIIKMQTNNQTKLKEKISFSPVEVKFRLVGIYFFFQFLLYIFFSLFLLCCGIGLLCFTFTQSTFSFAQYAQCVHFLVKPLFRFSYSLFYFRCRLSNALTMLAWLKLHHTAVCSYATELNVCSNQRLKSKTNVHTIWSHYYRKKAHMKKKRKKVHSTNLMKLNSQPLKFTFPFQAKHSFFIAL